MTLKEIKKQILELDPRIIVKPAMGEDFWIGPDIKLPSQLEKEAKALSQTDQSKLDEWLYDTYYETLRGCGKNLSQALTLLQNEVEDKVYKVPVVCHIAAQLTVVAKDPAAAIKEAERWVTRQASGRAQVDILENPTLEFDYAFGGDVTKVVLTESDEE